MKLFKFSFLSVLFIMGFTHLVGQKYLRNFSSVTSKAKTHNKLIFWAQDTTGNWGLWGTNGTPEGTILLKDGIDIKNNFPGYEDLFLYKDELYFAARTALEGVELWKTDGTPEGTFLLKDIKTVDGKGQNEGSSDPGEFCVFQDELYFTAAEMYSTRELWRTDGTPEGTVKIVSTTDGNPDDFLSIFSPFVVGNNLYFRSEYDDNPVWVLDGETMEVSSFQIDPLLEKSNWTPLENSFFVLTQDYYPDRARIYLVTPTENKQLLLLAYENEEVSIDNFHLAGSILFFTVSREGTNEDDELWKTDGTRTGTVLLRTFKKEQTYQAALRNFFVHDDELYFQERSTRTLWVSDGTSFGTKMIDGIQLSWNIIPAISDGKLFFVNPETKIFTYELESGSQELIEGITKAISPNGNNEGIFFDLDGLMYFFGSDDLGKSLWNYSPEPDLLLQDNLGTILPGDSLIMRSSVDSCLSYPLLLKNIGRKELYLSDISIKAKDFFIEGDLAGKLSPGEEVPLELMYIPSRIGKTLGEMDIISNDLNEGKVVVRLEGYAEKYADSSMVCFPLSQALKPLPPASKLFLSNSVISEQLLVGELVGEISDLEDENLTSFYFAKGEGDRDNYRFSITGNKLYSQQTFDYNRSNLFSIRVKAANQTDQDASIFLLHVQRENNLTQYERCGDDFVTLKNTLSDVEFIDESTAVAVGRNGFVIVSKDGGNTWNKVNGEINLHFEQVEFTDDSTLYAIAERFTENRGFPERVWKSENLGKDWFPLNKHGKGRAHLTRISFPSEKVGFAVGLKNKIFYTKDGGKCWETWVNGPYSGDEYSDIHFFDEKEGLVVGRSRKILKTYDGGLNWEELEVSFPFDYSNTPRIQAVSDQLVFLSDEKGNLMKSTDRGSSWTTVLENSPLFSVKTLFINESIGYRVWDTIQKTEDGGASWFDIAEGFSSSRVEIGANVSGSKILVIGSGIFYGETDILLLEDEQVSIISKFGGDDLYTVSAPNDSTLFVFGVTNYVSHNNGVTWEEFPLFNSDWIFGSFFVNEQMGYAADRNQVFKTIDGGENWFIPQNNGLNTQFLRGLYFLSEERGYAYGREEKIFITNDGGNNWQEIVIENMSNEIAEIFFINKTTGFIIGQFNNQILKTIDSGMTWQVKANFEDVVLNSITFKDDSSAIVVGENYLEDKNLVARTVDQGESWEIIPQASGFELRDALYTEEGILYAATRAGMAISRDDGRTWDYIIGDRDMQSIIQSDETVICVGRDGSILKAEKQGKPNVPGYIYGERNLPLNSSSTYSVVPSLETSYSWSVGGPNHIQFDEDKACVTWTTPGTYELSVTSFNSCEFGETRTILVTVDSLIQPVIIGPDTVQASDSPTKYVTKFEEHHTYTWKVDPVQGINEDSNEIELIWGEVSSVLLTLIVTDTISGVRGQAEKIVFVDQTATSLDDLKEEVILSLKVFPNPVEDKVNIEKSLESAVASEVLISDFSGRVVKKLIWKENRVWDISDLPTGFYILTLKTERGMIAEKLIKK